MLSRQTYMQSRLNGDRREIPVYKDQTTDFSQLTEEALTVVACESATHVEYYHSFARDYASQGIAAAVRFGKALNALRAQLDTPQWKQFMEDRFPDMHESDLRMYMRFAKRPRRRSTVFGRFLRLLGARYRS